MVEDGAWESAAGGDEDKKRGPTEMIFPLFAG